MFEHPTAAEMSEFISSQLLVVMEHNTQELAVVSTVPEQLVGAHQLRVGLVGMACKLTGGKSAPDQLWSSLLSQTSHITHSPPQRWQGVCTRANAPAALLAGAFLADELHSILAVAHGGFSTAEAKQLDMHIQLLLETSMEALTDGGWSSSDAKSGRFGVFTASQPSDFVVPIPGFNVARVVASALRVAGPHRNTDAACSSGYLGTYHAMHAVQAGECSAAVVAGVSLLLKPDSALGSYMMGVLSLSGIMRPFDTAADGTVLGEACSALVLQAEAAEENSYAAVLPPAANCNNALSPSGFVDADMIQAAAEDALALAGITAQQLAACHPHGMGNPPSDAPELTGLVAALATTRDSELVLLGHKANLGHAVCAAGLLSVMVSALALQQCVMPVHLNVKTRMRMLRETDTVLLPVNSHVIMQSGATRLLHTSISGTSVSGYNVHMLLQCSLEGRLCSLHRSWLCANQMVTKPMAQLRARPALLLPTECPVALALGGQIVASVSGTSASGDNVHTVLQHDGHSLCCVPELQPMLRQEEYSTPPLHDALLTMNEEELPATDEINQSQKAHKLPYRRQLEETSWLVGLALKGGSAVVTNSLERPLNRGKCNLSVAHVYDHGPLSHEIAQELQVLQAAHDAEQDMNATFGVALATEGILLGTIAGNTCTKVATKLQPMLTKEGYSTTPSFSTLLAMGPEELCAITGFKVHRTNVGSLEWLVPVDLRGANLDWVDISLAGVTLDKSQLPMLDCPCQVVAEQVFPKPSASAKKALHFAKKLKTRIEQSRYSFESYDAQSGVLRFQVEHFSRVSSELHPN